MENILLEVLGHNGRMVGGSKSRYRTNKPNNVVVFNSNLCTESGKIWYGDLDLTEDQSKLTFLAKELDQDLYVLFEMDGRFENESSPKLEHALAVFKQDGTITLHEDHRQYIIIKDGKLTRK